MSSHQAVVVLGGGLRGNGEIPPWSVARFELALAIRGEAPVICLSAGTVHKPPPLDGEGFPIFEARAGAAYLRQRGIGPEKIRVESTSYDTIGNAYYLKLLQIDPEGWRSVVVITSEFHMRRTRAIFDWIFGMEGDKYRLQFAASPDESLKPEALAVRRAKEEAAIEKLEPIRQSLRTPLQLHRWINTEHSAYAAKDASRAPRELDQALLESY